MQGASLQNLPGNAAPGIVVTRSDPGVALITLARPAARNSLSLAMIADLHGAIEACAADDGVKVVIIAAEGPAFSAGHDLKELTARRGDADGGLAFYRETMQRCSALMQTIVACPKPVIAAVEGVATAAGCQLVATCDLATAGAAARFCTPGVDIGLFCSTPMVALSRNVPRKRAMEMLLSGEMIGAETAAAWGLVNRVTPAGAALNEARSLARAIAGKSPVTLAIGKKAFYAQAEMRLAEAYDYAADVMARNMLERDAAEGIAAFLEKRPPRWSGC